MNCTQRSGLHVREFLNSQDINDFVLPKHPMNMTDEFGKLQSHQTLAPHLTTQWTDLNAKAMQTNETSDPLSPALHSHFEQTLLHDHQADFQEQGNTIELLTLLSTVEMYDVQNQHVNAMLQEISDLQDTVRKVTVQQ